MRTLQECATLCITLPIVRRLGMENLTVLDLLLSKSSVANEADKEKVRNIFQSLIDLKNPLINHMLEIAAYFAYHYQVYFYFTNTAEIRTHTHRHCAGAYVESHKLMLLPVDITDEIKPESVLIHELAHYISHRVGAHSHHTSSRFFIDTFEREGRNGPGTYVRGHARYELQRVEMFNAITMGYEENHQEGEYIPFFLGMVVSAALSTPDPFSAIFPSGVPEDFPERDACRAAYVFGILFRQMPTLNGQLLHEGFKRRVDRFYNQTVYDKFVELKVPTLEYHDGYACEFPETAKIIHMPYSYK